MARREATGRMDGWIRGWGGMGGSSGEPDLTNELIAGESCSLTRITARSPYLHLQKRMIVSKIYFDFVCNVLVVGV